MKTRQYLAILVLTCGATIASAQTIESRVTDCAGVTDSQQRLACFDALAIDLASGVKQAAQEHDPSTSSSVDPDTMSGSSGHSSDEKFGLEHKDERKGQAKELQARVSGIYKNTLGQMILMLDNGQIWQQKDTKTLIIDTGDPVLIERGFMSAFYLSARDKKRISVARVK